MLKHMQLCLDYSHAVRDLLEPNAGVFKSDLLIHEHPWPSLLSDLRKCHPGTPALLRNLP